MYIYIYIVYIYYIYIFYIPKKNVFVAGMTQEKPNIALFPLWSH